MNNSQLIKESAYRLMNQFSIFNEKLVTIDANLEYHYPDVVCELEKFKILFTTTFQDALDKIEGMNLIIKEFENSTGYCFEALELESGLKYKVLRWYNMVQYDSLISDEDFDHNGSYFEFCRKIKYTGELDEYGEYDYIDEHEEPGFDEKTEKFVMELYEQIKDGLQMVKRDIEKKIYSFQDGSNVIIENRELFDPKIHNEGIKMFMKILNEIDTQLEYEYSFTSGKDWRYFSKVLFCFYNNLKMDEPIIRITLNEGSKTRFYGLNLGIRKTLRKGKPLTSDFQFQQIMIDYIDHDTPLTTEQFYEKIKGLSKSLQMPGKTSCLLKELKGQMT